MVAKNLLGNLNLESTQQDVLTELRRLDFLTPSEGLSSTQISGSQWVGNTFTSEWERVLQPYFSTILQVDEPGFLFFDFSLDGGTTFSSYPVHGVVVAPGINEVHGAYKASRSMRIRFIGEGGRTYFRLLTDYSSIPVVLSAPLNQEIGADQDATVTRAVVEGAVLDNNLAATSAYNQAGLLPGNALRVGQAPELLVDQVLSNLPSGPAVTIDPVLNTEPNVYDSGWIPSAAYHSQLFNGKVDGSIAIYLCNAPDDQGTNFTGGDFPFAVTTPNAPLPGGSMFFPKFFRMVAVNTSGSDVSGYVTCQGHYNPLGSILTALNSPLFDFFPAPVTRTVITKRQPDGDYVNSGATGRALNQQGNEVVFNDIITAGNSEALGWVDTDQWDHGQVVVTSSVPGTLLIQYTEDANVPTPTVLFTDRLEFSETDASVGHAVFPVPFREDGFQVVYQQGDLDGPVFIGLTLRDTSGVPSSRAYSGELGLAERAALTRAVISAFNDEDVESKIGRVADALKSHISTVDESAEIGTRVNQISAEFTEQPPTFGQTFRRVVTSDVVTQIPLPSNLSRVLGLTIRHAGTIGLGENDNEETLYWSWSPGSVSSEGFPLYAQDPQDFSYGQAEGADVTSIKPLYFQCSGTSSETVNNIDSSGVAISTGVVDPENMIGSDNARAIFSANTHTATLNFSLAGITSTVTSVQMCVEARKEPGAIGNASSSTQAEAVASGSSTVITTPTIVAEPNQWLVVMFSRRNTDAAKITTNPFSNTMGYVGQPTIIDLGDAQGDLDNENEARLSIAYFPPQAGITNGTVSMTVTEGSSHECASFVYLDSIDPSGLIVETLKGNSQGSFTDTIAGTQNGIVLQCISSEITFVNSVAGNMVEIASTPDDAGNNNQSMSVGVDLVESAGSITWGANMSQDGDVVAAAISFPPAAAQDPQARISNSEGATTLTNIFSSESDEVATIDITGDRASWDQNTQISLTIESPFISGANLEVDRLWLKVGTSSGSVDLRIAWIGYE